MQITWDLVVLIVLIITCIEVLSFSCFSAICAWIRVFRQYVSILLSNHQVPYTLGFNIDLTLDMPFGVVSLLIDCFLLVDVAVNFRTAYFDSLAPF